MNKKQGKKKATILEFSLMFWVKTGVCFYNFFGNEDSISTQKSTQLAARRVFIFQKKKKSLPRFRLPHVNFMPSSGLRDTAHDQGLE